MSAADVQSQLQSEVQEMRRKIRIMENDKKAYVEESDQMLKRQANLIDKLKEENK
jgi:chromosome segregation ATPase